MSVDDSTLRREWVQVDSYGELTGKPFTSTPDDLRAHLTRDLPDDAATGPAAASVYVRSSGSMVSGPVVTLRTPWGTQSWIPRPAPHPPRRYAWLMRF